MSEMSSMRIEKWANAFEHPNAPRRVFNLIEPRSY